MAREPSENIKKAEALYKNGTAMVEIAKQLGVSDSTVRSWKNRYKWDNGKSATLQKKECNVAKIKRPKNGTKEKPAAQEVEEVIQNTELTDKQRLFCQFYIKYRNKTKAYQKAFGCSYECACSNASTLWKNSEVQNEIKMLLDRYRSNIELDIKDLIQWHLDIARADINDFVQVRGLGVKVKEEFDGTVVSEISETANGIKVKLADRMKAMQWLSDHMDLATEEQKARIAVLKAKVETGEEEGDADDGFIDALNASAGSDWSDEED